MQRDAGSNRRSWTVSSLVEWAGCTRPAGGSLSGGVAIHFTTDAKVTQEGVKPYWERRGGGTSWKSTKQEFG